MKNAENRYCISKVLTLFFLLAGHWNIQAQELPCANETIEPFLLQNPAYKAEFDAINQAIAAGNLYKTAAGTIIEIPIAVHIIHTGEPVGTGSNITDEQVLGAVQGANDRWRKITGDGADMEVQFCLAQTDPLGNPSNGIDRRDGSGVRYYKDYGIAYIGALGDTGANETTIKNLSNWPHTYVFNIWVVNKIAGGWGGYCLFPLINNFPTDGVVIISSIMKYTSSTLAHEIGHGMGLFHTFQGDYTGCPGNGNCSLLGDQVCDTPPHKQADCSTTNCSNAPDSALALSFKNYMSYCGGRNLFTQGQKDRSRNIILTTSRKYLLNSTACIRTCDTAFTHIETSTCDPITVNIHYDTLNTVSGCDSIIITNTTLIAPVPVADLSYSAAGNTVSFSNLSANATSYAWNFGDDSTSTEASPTHTYTAAGTYEVELIASNACSSDTAYATVYLITTGLGKNNTLQSIRLYPNPSKGVFTLEMSVNGTGTSVEIFNTLGQAVAKQVLSNGKLHTISPGNTLPNGLYQVHIRENGQMLGTVPLVIYH